MDESRIIIEFDYRPQRVKLIAVTLLATAGVALLTYGALTLGGPIDIKGFRLTRRQGRMFFGIFACLSAAGLVPLLAGIWVSVFRNRRVALLSQSIVLPKPTLTGLSCKEIEIDFASIYSVQICDFIGGCKLLRMDHQDGVTCIPSNMIADSNRFVQLCELIREAVSNNRPRKLAEQLHQGITKSPS